LYTHKTLEEKLLTKEEGVSKKSLHTLEKTRSGVTRMVVIALVVIIVVVVVVAAYIALLRSSSSPTPTPTQTRARMVPWQEMANYQTDYWNVTAKQPYTVLLNDSMTVSSGGQWLTITAYSSNVSIWSVQFINSTYIRYSNSNDYGFLRCNGGIVYVTVNDTAITYTGATSHTSSPSGVNFPSLAQIQTDNGDGNFNGGYLDMTLTS
jgi:hypothetical protein